MPNRPYVEQEIPRTLASLDNEKAVGEDGALRALRNAKSELTTIYTKNHNNTNAGNQYQNDGVKGEKYTYL